MVIQRTYIISYIEDRLFELSVLDENQKEIYGVVRYPQIPEDGYLDVLDRMKERQTTIDLGKTYRVINKIF